MEKRVSFTGYPNETGAISIDAASAEDQSKIIRGGQEMGVEVHCKTGTLVVLSSVYRCNHKEEKGVDALMVIFANGYTEIHCPGRCSPCPYGKLRE